MPSLPGQRQPRGWGISLEFDDEMQLYSIYLILLVWGEGFKEGEKLVGMLQRGRTCLYVFRCPRLCLCCLQHCCVFLVLYSYKGLAL